MITDYRTEEKILIKLDRIIELLEEINKEQKSLDDEE